MKLLIVSHPCVTPVNQEFFAEVEAQTGWELTIVAPAHWKSDYGTRYLERWPRFQGELIPIPVWNAGNIPLHIYQSFFVSLLNLQDPDVIFMHHEPYALATGQVYVANRLSIQSPIGFFTWQNIQKRYPLPIRCLEQMVYRDSQYAISGSKSASRVLREKGYENRISVIPGGIDPKIYNSVPPIDLHDKLDLSNSKTIIGYAGRIVEEKGLSTLLQALTQLRDYSWHLVVLGKGPFEESLRRQADDLGIKQDISFLGYVPHTETPNYLSAFDFTVLPSETQPHWKEQFGRIIIESLACETPIIGSNSGEIPHVINDLQGGLVFPEGQSDQLANQLRILISNDNLRDHLAQSGHKKVHTSYTNSSLTKEFIQTIQQVAPTRNTIA